MPAPNEMKDRFTRLTPGTPSPVARTASAASASADPLWGVESVVSDSTRKGLAFPKVPSQARMSSPPLLCATTCTLSTPKRCTTLGSWVWRLSMLLAMVAEPPEDGARLMLLSVTTPAAASAPAKPRRVKKPPFEVYRPVSWVFFSGAQVLRISSVNVPGGTPCSESMTSMSSSCRNDTDSPLSSTRVRFSSSPCSFSGWAGTSALRSICMRLMTSVFAGSRSNVRSTRRIQNAGAA